MYLGATDTSGQFNLGPLPGGIYTVRALIDQNSNRVFDRNEKWDSTSVTVTTSQPSIELDAIERDTVPPAFANVNVDDSVTMTITSTNRSTRRYRSSRRWSRLQRADSSEHHGGARPVGGSLRPDARRARRLRKASRLAATRRVGRQSTAGSATATTALVARGPGHRREDRERPHPSARSS